MRFGKTLLASIYAPWREHYIDYTKLKQLLREGSDDSDHGSRVASPADEGREWTEHDESVFVEELINVQLEKVNNFQRQMSAELKDRTAKCEARLEKMVAPGEVETDKFSHLERRRILEQTREELDTITRDINELERFSRINFTGFLKAAKKHDRSRGASVTGKQKHRGKGKGRDAGQAKYNVRPLLQVRLSQLEFNKEDYSPLLYRLSAMYAFVRQNLEDDQKEPSQLRSTSELSADTHPGNRKYTSHKFWVHPDNILEVKTFILRRLPVLIYNPQPSKEVDSKRLDPTITSLYFDNPNFSLYTGKLLKERDATSLRLRWYGQLSEASEIYFERKTINGTVDDSQGAVEERISLKQKYVNDFINGDYSMEKTIQKMRDSSSSGKEEVEKYEALVASLQNFVRDNNLQPVLRASYTRTAFQIPGDDSIRVSLDTDLALIREDAIDRERPCRDPENWHRIDIDDAKMEHPFSSLRKGEISLFPYALLELKVLDSALQQRSREWIDELVYSHLVHGAPRFSKFVHGVSVLFEDYVNCFPFWLSEMDKDIRKDPADAFNEEQERKKKQVEDQLAVGSLTHTVRDFGGRSSPHTFIGQIPAPRPTEIGERKLPRVAFEGVGKVDAKKLPPPQEEEVSHQGSDEETEQPQRGAASLENLRKLFPSFSASRYGRAHSSRSRAVQLPPGVQKPGQLLMYQNPVQVESKVWFANQRTFLKWMHIAVLLAGLSTALYNSAGENNAFARWIAIVYTGIAVFAGLWGYGIYMWRSNLIRKRSGKDFDSIIGPVVVCVALAVALVVNFSFKYRAAKREQAWKENGSIVEHLVEQAPVLGLVRQKGY